VSTVERDVEIVNKFGLHARPAMQFVNEANKFTSRIEVHKGELSVDAKSIMSVMRLAATKGTVLRICADGDDAHDAVDALAALIEQGFGEMEDES
jgi:phosphocarrier protein